MIVDGVVVRRPVMVIDPKNVEADPRWVRIGGLCSAGRRSLWVRIGEGKIELCAGREGDDNQVTIDKSNPQFETLKELFSTAVWAVTT